MKIACIGSACFDIKLKSVGQLNPKSSNPVAAKMSSGGAARNVAENLARLGQEVAMISHLGNDERGSQIKNELTNLQIDTQGITHSLTHLTACYTAFLDQNGDMYIGAADMDIFDEVSPDLLKKNLFFLSKSSHWVIDSSFSTNTLTWICQNKPSHVKIFAMAISKAKVLKWKALLHYVDIFVLNSLELQTLTDIDNLEEAATSLLEKGVKSVVVTTGEKGGFIKTLDSMTPFSALKANVIDVTGAGDALTAGLIYGLANSHSLENSINFGLKAAKITIESEYTVSPQMHVELIKENYEK